MQTFSKFALRFFLLSWIFFVQIFSEEIFFQEQDYISKNTQIQILIAKTFLEDNLEAAEGFYDPRLGVVLYLSYKTNPVCLENASSKACTREKILKLQFLLAARKILSKNQRIFLHTDYIESNQLEIWRKEFLDKLESDNQNLENVSFGYMKLINGYHPTLGKYPNWEKIREILELTQKKFISLGFESVNAIFIPAKGFVFIIKTHHIPVKKLAKFNKRLIEKLRKMELSAQYVIEYFYGGKKGELSYFINIKNGRSDALKFWSENE